MAGFVYKNGCTKGITNSTELKNVQDTIKWIQRRLELKADGDYGKSTEQAVKDFQREWGFTVDGAVAKNGPFYGFLFGNRTLKPGDENKLIENFQRTLGITVTGKYDDNTKKALKDAGFIIDEDYVIGSNITYKVVNWQVTYQKGQRGNQIKRIRRILKLSEGNTYDDSVVKAVEKFQKENSLGVDGVAGPKTLRKIFAKGETYKKGDGYVSKDIFACNKGEGIRRIQNALGLTADGIFGAGTESAVKAFQQKNNLTADGIVDSKTYNLLISPTDVVCVIPKKMRDEMDRINVRLEDVDGYKTLAASLGRFPSPKIVAALIGVIIPESGADHARLNKSEYYGHGKSGTSGWECGEGFVQWTGWSNKSNWIKKYNADKRKVKSLPTTWNEYSKGKPIEKRGILRAKQDSTHIAGLSLDDQIVLLTIYYDKMIKELENETNLAVIVAKFFQQKAGPSHYYNYLFDPIIQTYYTGKIQYPQGEDNSFLKSLKYAEEYYENQVPPAEIEPIEGDTVQEKSGQTKEEKKQQREESKKKREEERQKKKEEREQRRKYKMQKIYKMNEGRRTRAKKGIILGAHMRQK